MTAKANAHSLKKALNPAYLRQTIGRAQMELFKSGLIDLLNQLSDTESEEFHKNAVSEFLKNTYYAPAYYINTKGRQDLVIHTGKDNKSDVGVIIEAKKPTNTAEMPTKAKLNCKALQELVLYYLRERITGNNKAIKNLVITNVHEWFIFDEALFDRFFAQNKKLVKAFEDFERESKKGTDWFYKEIASDYIKACEKELEFTHFKLADFEKPLRDTDKENDKKLISLYKVLSPEHLLKLPFANDSNQLDKKFYSELLHIIGLSEEKEKGKKIIQRCEPKGRNEASLLEATIIQLDARDRLSRIDKVSHYGATRDEQYFNVGLELCITWVNRLLFLKLLEGQLLSYNKGNKQYKFLDFETIQNYDDLDTLFFQVLAKTSTERRQAILEKFAHIPYLNSSLFEPTHLEQECLFVSNLADDRKIPISGKTVLKDDKGKTRKGDMVTLEYLFAFLDAYNFSSEGAEEIQEENKTLINASVLGLIFEKINGYKDGSFFTPGFITMYMCRETLRRSVVQKFNDAKAWGCKEFDELYNRIEDPKEANEIINSLKICDPAVGSGHFLVSALNELITIKHELGILQDAKGKKLRDVTIEVVNDELIVKDQDELFEYNPKSKESQRIQETLFREKQTIIENCLFGVDINPNSVKICRLRLWVELLKNAYYQAKETKVSLSSGTVLIRELETLPNIDINIKCGNSLISRFALDADLKKALKSVKWKISDYKAFVKEYKHATNKEEKRGLETLIEQIKGDFKSEINKNDPKVRRLQRLNAELWTKYESGDLFERKLSAAEKRDKKKLLADIEKLTNEIEEIKSNKVYENAFEWRFMFPEVLNDNGEFDGFDTIIGNPPYIRQEELQEFKGYFKSRFATFAGTADLFVYFIEHGLNLLKNEGHFIYIVPNKWMRAGYGKALREHLIQKRILNILDFGDLPVFEEATTYPCIISIQESQQPNEMFDASNIHTLDFDFGLDGYVQQRRINVLQNELQAGGWTLSDAKEQKLLAKLKEHSVSLGEYIDGKIYRGVLTGLNEAFVIDEDTRTRLIEQDPKSEQIIKPFLAGRDIKRYKKPKSHYYLILFRSGDTRNWFGEKDENGGWISLNEQIAWTRLNEEYPALCNHLKKFKSKARERYDQGHYWWELRACDYYEEFEKEKIAWPETSSDNQFTMVIEGDYLNKTCFFIPKSDCFLLGLLNSKLAKFYFDSIVSKMRGGYFSMSKAYVETIPISKQDQSLIEQIDSATQSFLGSSNIEALAEIDTLIYKLYNLTESEIKTLEESVK